MAASEEKLERRLASLREAVRQLDTGDESRKHTEEHNSSAAKGVAEEGILAALEDVEQAADDQGQATCSVSRLSDAVDDLAARLRRARALLKSSLEAADCPDDVATVTSSKKSKQLSNAREKLAVAENEGAQHAEMLSKVVGSLAKEDLELQRHEAVQVERLARLKGAGGVEHAIEAIRAELEKTGIDLDAVARSTRNGWCADGMHDTAVAASGLLTAMRQSKTNDRHERDACDKVARRSPSAEQDLGRVSAARPKCRPRRPSQESPSNRSDAPDANTTADVKSRVVENDDDEYREKRLLLQQLREEQQREVESPSLQRAPTKQMVRRKRRRVVSPPDEQPANENCDESEGNADAQPRLRKKVRRRRVVDEAVTARAPSVQSEVHSRDKSASKPRARVRVRKRREPK